MLTCSVHAIHMRIPSPSIHEALSPPPAFPPVKLPHVELPHPMMWSPMGKSFTTTVLFDFMPVAQQGNDAGIGVIHISIPPTNPILPLTIATSKCKNLFGAGTVKVQGKPAAGFLPILAPVLICNWPVPIPWMILPLPNTVMVGLTLMDFVAGWARILVDVAVSAVFAFAGGRIPGFERMGEMGGRLATRLGMSIIGQTVLTNIAQDMFKGVFVSLITNGKIELPFQIGEYNVMTGDGKIFTHEFDTGQDLPDVNIGGGIDAAQNAGVPDPNAGAADGLPACN